MNMKGSPNIKVFYRVNATFNHAVESFLKVSEFPREIQCCCVLVFCISAITEDQTELASFTVFGAYMPSTIDNNDKLKVDDE